MVVFLCSIRERSSYPSLLPWSQSKPLVEKKSKVVVAFCTCCSLVFTACSSSPKHHSPVIPERKYEKSFKYFLFHLRLPFLRTFRQKTAHELHELYVPRAERVAARRVSLGSMGFLSIHSYNYPQILCQ